MTAQILIGDVLRRLAPLADQSVDSIVTDPPYELGFMGKRWDSTGIANSVEMWRECLRVLKPGGHLLAFGGSRTYHRMACAIEDAAFEIRDQIQWIYGSGFPKSMNIGNGMGTALKPAHEPICLARKAFTGTVAANVEAHGTGALNIDVCRVEGLMDGVWGSSNKTVNPNRTFVGSPAAAEYKTTPHAAGRWPANVIHDGSEEVVNCFPSEAGAVAPVTRRNGDKFRNTFGAFAGSIDEEGTTFHADQGSAARFFYCPKTDREERNQGCYELASKPLNWSSGTQSPGTFQAEGTNRSAENFHPTVKPTDLMAYLCRLVTPQGGTVLDPFTGSGSTGIAALREGFNFIGIEINPEYARIAEKRIGAEAPMFNTVEVVA